MNDKVRFAKALDSSTNWVYLGLTVLQSILMIFGVEFPLQPEMLAGTVLTWGPAYGLKEGLKR